MSNTVRWITYSSLDPENVSPGIYPASIIGVEVEVEEDGSTLTFKLHLGDKKEGENNAG